MKATIVKAFQNDGCMTEIRSPARRILYLEDEMTALQLRMNAIMQGEEPNRIAEIALAGDVDDIVEENFVEPAE